MNENENTFDAENPWVEVSLFHAKDIIKEGTHEVYWRPDGRECALIRRVQ